MTSTFPPPFGLLKKILRPIFRAAIKLHAALSEHKYRYVFVLAHVRSGSTLLSHILASNPQFAFAGESYLTYTTPHDLQQLIVETCQRLHKIWLSAPYIVDQINHAYISHEILNSPLVDRCVILIRQPEATLKSAIVTPGAPGMPGMPEKEALDYYVNRLDELVEYGVLLKDRALLIEYDDLVDRHQEILAALTDFFGTTQPFEATYRKHRLTGHIGDPSINIKAGHIIRTQPHKIDISSKTIRDSSVAFQNCRQRLLLAGVRFAKRPR